MSVQRSSVIQGVVFVCVVGLIVFVFWGRVRNTPFTMKRKVAEYTNEVVRARFDAPKGKLFNLVLGVPGGLSTNEFGAEIELEAEGVAKQTSRVVRADLQSCNWLVDEGLAEAYILTWSANEERERLKFQTQAVNTVTIRFSPKPPTNSSVWVTWVQLYRDREK